MFASIHASNHVSTAPIAAFFDLDNTLVPGSATEVRFFRFLYRRGLIGAREARRSLLYWLREGPLWSFHALRSRKVYLEGKPVSDIERLAEEFVHATIRDTVAAAARDAVSFHQTAGHRTILLTAAPVFLAKPLAAHLRMDAILAAQPEQRDGTYTGALHDPLPYGPGKRALLTAFAVTHGLDLAGCHVYGDSPGDVDALQAVGYPHVVNPIRGMGRIASRRGWPVSRWK